MRKHRRLVATIAAVTAVAVAAGLYWFQPWKLWVDHTVDERLPAVALDAGTVSPSVAPQTAATPTRTPTTPPTPGSATPPKPVATLLSRGRLISHEHPTRGTVGIVRQADGSRVLVIRGLDTSDGPDVEVWLTDQPVLAGKAGWYVFDDGRHLRLGDLKGNLGNQVYEIPDGADLRRLTSVSLWCARFDVSFGAATLRRIG